MEKKEPKGGYLLLAEPFMSDSNFKRTVVLLCSHEEENGTFGLVINRQLEYRLGDAVPELDFFNVPIYYGGPMDLEQTLHYVHKHGELIEGSIKIAEDLYWGGGFDEIKEYITMGVIQPETIRFFTGYSGWEPGQLANELEQNSWIMTDASSKYIYTKEPDEMWRTVLQDMGGKYKMYSNFPEDPRLN